MFLSVDFEFFVCRHLGFHYLFSIDELGPLAIFYGGHFEKSLIVFVKRPGKCTQRQRKLLTKQLSGLARKRVMFEDFRKMVEDGCKSVNKSGVGAGSNHPEKSRLLGKSYTVDASGLNGDAKGLFGDSGALIAQARYIEGDEEWDSRAVSEKLRKIAKSNSPELVCFPSLSHYLSTKAESETSNAAAEDEYLSSSAVGTKVTIHGTRENKSEDWVYVTFSSNKGKNSTCPCQLQCYFTVTVQVSDNGMVSERLFAVVRCLDKLKQNRTLRLQHSELTPGVYVVPVASIEAVALVSKDVNYNGNYWWVLPERTNFPDVLGIHGTETNNSTAPVEDLDNTVEDEECANDEGDVFDSDCDYEWNDE